MSQGVTKTNPTPKTPDEITADEVLCYIGRPLSPEHMACYAKWARIWNPINLVRFGIKDQMNTAVFNRVWARTTRPLLNLVNEGHTDAVRQACGAGIF